MDASALFNLDCGVLGLVRCSSVLLLFDGASLDENVELFGVNCPPPTSSMEKLTTLTVNISSSVESSTAVVVGCSGVMLGDTRRVRLVVGCV